MCLALWTTAYQAPLSTGFSRQEYWSELSFPSTGDLPDPGIKPRSPTLQVDSLLLSHQRSSQLQPLVRFSSVAQSCSTLCDPMNRSMPGLPVHHHLPEFTLTHVHRVRDAIQPSFEMCCHPVGEGCGTPLQYSCLENPMDRGAWQTAVHGVAKSWTRLSDFTFPFQFHAWEKEMATHSSILAWRIPGTEEPSGLPSMGLHRVGHD